MERADDVVVQWGLHEYTRQVVTFIYIDQQTAFGNQSVPGVKILLKTAVELYLIGVRFAFSVDATNYSSYCRVRALLVEPVGL